MKKPHTFALSAFFALACLLIAGFSSAQDDINQQAAISHVEGSVEIKTAGAKEWQGANYSTALTEGDAIRTAKGARVVIDIKDQSDIISIDVTESSQLAFLTFDKDAKTGSKTTLLDLSLGEVTVNSISVDRSRNKFEIKTPTSMIDIMNGDTSLKVTVTHDAE